MTLDINTLIEKAQELCGPEAELASSGEIMVQTIQIGQSNFDLFLVIRSHEDPYPAVSDN